MEDNEVLLVGSRSTLGKVPEIKGLYRSKKMGRMESVTLNGPQISLGFNFKRVWSWIIFEFNLFRFRNKIKAFKPDVVIVSSLSILTFLYGVFLKKWLKVPLVLEIRDIYPLTLVEVGKYSPNHPAVKVLGWVEKFGYKHADLILSTLPNASEHIGNVIKKPFRFKWIPMGVDPEYLVNEDQPHLAEQILGPKKGGEFRVGYGGTLGVANALELLFETAEEFENSYPQIKFIFIGDGPLKPGFQEKYGHLSNIRFIPPVKKRELQPLLQEMDILINPCLDVPIYRFGVSPNKWMDYMHAARPLLVAYSGKKCIIDEAGCGIFVEANNKEKLKEGILQFFHTDPAELTEMGARGKAYLYKKLTYKALAEDLNESLNNLLYSTATNTVLNG